MRTHCVRTREKTFPAKPCSVCARYKYSHLLFHEEWATSPNVSTPQRDVVLPGIVVYELGRGVLKSQSPKRRAQFAAFVDAFTVLPLGRAEAEAAARISDALEQRGLPIGPLDILIAGTSLVHGATPVTRNPREFSREGLKLAR